MTKKVVTPYFPTGMKFVVGLVFIVGLYLAFGNHLILGIVIMAVCAVAVTINYVTEIDLDEKHYSDYLSIAGMKTNEESRTFTTIHHVIITKGNYSQKIQTRVQSRQMDWSDYTATLLFDDDKLDILTRSKKRELLLEIKPLVEFLNVGVEDCCSREPYWIDMAAVV